MPNYNKLYSPGLLLSQGAMYPDYLVHKFGHNDEVSQAAFVPLSVDAIYNTPQVSGAIAMRVKAGGNAADDDAAGAGARKIIIQGLDETGALQQEELTLNGAAVGSTGTITFMRLFRAWVSESGTYGNATSPSHVGDIIVEDTGGAQWLNIHAGDFSAAQSEISSFSIPLDYKGYLVSLGVTVASTKTAEIIFIQRAGILETAAPYSRLGAVRRLIGQANHYSEDLSNCPIEFDELTDIGFMGKAAGINTGISAHFGLVLKKIRNLNP